MHEKLTVHERTEYIKGLFQKVEDVLNSKGADYGGAEANSNFRNAAADMDVTPYQVWFVYFHKHLSSLKAFIRDGKLESEPIESRLLDLVTYIFILWSMCAEDGVFHGAGEDSPTLMARMLPVIQEVNEAISLDGGIPDARP